MLLLGWGASRSDIFLIVCGSATAWIVQKLIGNKGFSCGDKNKECVAPDDDYHLRYRSRHVCRHIAVCSDDERFIFREMTINRDAKWRFTARYVAAHNATIIVITTMMSQIICDSTPVTRYWYEIRCFVYRFLVEGVTNSFILDFSTPAPRYW